MSLGYQRLLYLLPSDHRHSYVTGMFKFTPPLTADEHSGVADSKQVIYEGFRRALGGDVPISDAGILVDEEFGGGILRDARANGYVTALSTEKSGCIVLGRADAQTVGRWLTVAASVPGFIGFAVGRPTSWDAVADCVGERATRPEAARIARRYRQWAAIFARGQAT